MTDPLPVLAAFSRQEADLDAVFRTLVSFDDWLAPAAHVQDRYAIAKFGALAWYGGRAPIPGNELWLFTDPTAVDRAEAAGAALGAVGSPLSGTTLFAALDPGLAAVRVNPFSPPELTWNVPPEGFRMAEVWAAAVSAERALEGDDPRAAFRRLPEVVVYLHPTGKVVTLPAVGGLANPVCVLTAPDCERAFLARVPPAVAATFHRGVTAPRVSCTARGRWRHHRRARLGGLTPPARWVAIRVFAGEPPFPTRFVTARP